MVMTKIGPMSNKGGMTMRRITNIILLSAGVLLSLTGCQKGNETADSNGAVRFSAKTNVETRTSFSGDRSSGDKERVDWSANDQIMIWSDNAAVPEGRTPYFAGNPNLAVYKLTNITESGSKSVANIVNETGNALHYPDGNQACQFWGLYPAGAVTESPVDNTVSLAIDAVQDITLNSNTTDVNSYVPDMSQAYMLAYVSGAKESDSSVELAFKPAFTDFEFNITTKLDYDLTITAMEITSESTALSGDFTASFANGKWGFEIADDAAKSVKAILPEGGLTIPKNASDDKKTLSLNVFALPQNLKDLKVIFTTNEGRKTMKLTLPSDKTKMKEFTGCYKHRINGLILPTGWFFSYITLDLKVVDWQAVDVTGGSEEFPQATQFAVSGEGVKNGYTDINHGIGDKDPYRQQWYFQKGQTVTVFFKIMLPVNGTWKLEPVGGVEGAEADLDPNFVFTNAYTGATGDAALTGTIDDSGNTAIKIEITYTGDDPASFFFHSYAIKGGYKYNIDSETQIYDRGRGYHTFFVNNPAYNN